MLPNIILPIVGFGYGSHQIRKLISKYCEVKLNWKFHGYARFLWLWKLYQSQSLTWIYFVRKTQPNREVYSNIIPASLQVTFSLTESKQKHSVISIQSTSHHVYQISSTISQLRLSHIPYTSHTHLSHISTISQPPLYHISPTYQLNLTHISTTSRQFRFSFKFRWGWGWCFPIRICSNNPPEMNESQRKFRLYVPLVCLGGGYSPLWTNMRFSYIGFLKGIHYQNF